MTLKGTPARSVCMSNYQTGNLCNSLIVGTTTTSASETEAAGQHGGLLLLEMTQENLAVYKYSYRRGKHIIFTKLRFKQSGFKQNAAHLQQIFTKERIRRWVSTKGKH